MFFCSDLLGFDSSRDVREFFFARHGSGEESSESCPRNGMVGEETASQSEGIPRSGSRNCAAGVPEIRGARS